MVLNVASDMDLALLCAYNRVTRASLMFVAPASTMVSAVRRDSGPEVDSEFTRWVARRPSSGVVLGI